MRIVCWNTRGSATKWREKQFKQMLELANADVGVLLEPPSAGTFKDLPTPSRQSSRGRSAPNPGTRLEEPSGDWSSVRNNLARADVGTESLVYLARPGVTVKLIDTVDKANVYKITSAALSVTAAFTHIPFTTASPPAFLSGLQSNLDRKGGVDILMGDVNCYGTENTSTSGRGKRKLEEEWEVKLQSKTGRAKDATLDRIYGNPKQSSIKISQCGRIYPSTYQTRLEPMSDADQTRGNHDLPLDFKELAQGYLMSDHLAIYVDVIPLDSTTDADADLRPSKRQRAASQEAVSDSDAAA
jgi:hypothetical protein